MVPVVCGLIRVLVDPNLHHSFILGHTLYHLYRGCLAGLQGFTYLSLHYWHLSLMPDACVVITLRCCVLDKEFLGFVVLCCNLQCSMMSCTILGWPQLNWVGFAVMYCLVCLYCSIVVLLYCVEWCNRLYCSIVVLTSLEIRPRTNRLVQPPCLRKTGYTITLSPSQCSVVQCSVVQCSVVQCSVVQ